MGVLLWLLARHDASGIVVIALCVAGVTSYAILGVVLGILRIDELKAAFRRRPPAPAAATAPVPDERP